MTRRRSFIQKAGASIVGAGLVTGSATADSDTPRSGEYYEILGDGTLRYTGPDETDGRNLLKEATSIFNAGKKRGDWSFRLPDERIHVVSETTGASKAQSATGASTVRPMGACPGKSDYDRTFDALDGFRHKFWFDNCQTETLLKRLEEGALYSEVAVLIAGFFAGMAPWAPAVAAAAGIVIKAGHMQISRKSEGHGVKIWMESPRLPTLDAFGVVSQS